MLVTYYVLGRKAIQVGDEFREQGDLIPEAANWPFLSAYLRDGDVAPVLVATLPAAARKALEEWEAEQPKDEVEDVVEIIQHVPDPIEEASI